MIRSPTLHLHPARVDSSVRNDAPAAAILLPGLGRTARSARSLARDLARRGFNAIAVGYPSRAADVDTLAALVFKTVQEHPAVVAAPLVVMATHSLGGILLRAYLENHPWPTLKRVVMLGPPNRGSEAADALAQRPWIRRALGPALDDLCTDLRSRVNRLPAWPTHIPLKIIAGARSHDPWFAPLFSSPNDGKVAVDRTRLEGAAEHAVVAVSHPFLMSHPQSRKLAVEFLDPGRDSACPPSGNG